MPYGIKIRRTSVTGRTVEEWFCGPRAGHPVTFSRLEDADRQARSMNAFEERVSEKLGRAPKRRFVAVRFG